VLLLLSLPVLAGKVILPALNQTICWELLINIAKSGYLCLKQSAECLFYFYNSGTFRDHTSEYFYSSFCLSTFLPTKPLMFGRFSVDKYREDSHQRKFNSLFCSYITGLIEGDGTIIVPKTLRSPSGQANYASIEIVFDVRDLPLAIVIQRELGFGSISQSNKVNSCRLTIKNAAGLATMVELMNGYLRTPKIIMFNRLIGFLNQKYPTLHLSEKKEVDKSALDSNAWLAGFIDADGNFSVNFNSVSIACCEFRLVQSSVNHLNLSQRDLMYSLSKFLNVKLSENTRKEWPGYLEYAVRTGSKKSNEILVFYLERYSLFSSKYLNYKAYKEVFDMIIKKEHLTKKGKKKIDLIKEGMNNKRTEFNWDHLLNFHKIDS